MSEAEEIDTSIMEVDGDDNNTSSSSNCSSSSNSSRRSKCPSTEAKDSESGSKCQRQSDQCSDETGAASSLATTTTSAAAAPVTTSAAKAPVTPGSKSLNRSFGKGVASSAEKNLKIQQKLEAAKKRQDEKEKKERERKEREEQRLKREEEARKRKEEEERQRLKRQEEKKKLDQERQEKKEEEERQRLKRLEEKEKLAQEKQEKEKQRLELLNAKNEERKKKEEEKQKEEEEKRRKADKVKTQFVSYFIKKETNNSSDKEEQRMYRFMPFQPKENMTIAPLCRRSDLLAMSYDERLDFMEEIDNQVMDASSTPQKSANYLVELRADPSRARKITVGCRKKKFCGGVNEESINFDEIKLLDPVEQAAINENRFRVKYLHFDPKQHRRPPYFGTWRKKSTKVRARQPFNKDDKLIDYDVNSDDEWEDEPDGESIAESVNDDDDETVDDEDDDGFFVPHGHLSDDELDEDERMLDPETKKVRELAKKEQWENERKKASKVLRAKWFVAVNYWNYPHECAGNNAVEMKHLDRLQMVPLVTSFPIALISEKANAPSTAKKTCDDTSTPKSKINRVNNSTSNLGGVDASPNSTASKSSKASKQKQHQQQLLQSAQQSPLSATSAAAAQLNQSGTAASPSSSSLLQLQPPTSNSSSSTTTTSIIKFISKMSKKSIVCSVEPSAGGQALGGIGNASTGPPTEPEPTATFSVAVVTTPTAPTMSTPTLSASSKIQPQATTGGTATSRTPNLNKTTSQLALSNSKVTPNNNNSNTSSSTVVAEKRVCSGNGENAVKRLRLDQNKDLKEAVAAVAAVPVVQTLVVASMFKNGSCKKSLKLVSSSSSIGSSSSSDMANCAAMPSTPPAPPPQQPPSDLIKSVSILNNQPKIADLVCGTNANKSGSLKSTATSDLHSLIVHKKENNKENTDAVCITIDD